MKRRLFINGAWVDTRDYSMLRSPYSGEVIAEIPVAGEEDIEQAIQAAYEAGTVMARMPAYQRAAILERLSGLIEARAGEAARLLALEVAKPIRTAMLEVERTIETYRFAAEEAKRIHGETLPLDASKSGEGRLAYTLREPLGVIGAITPFNFPMNLVAHKVGPAIAAGNAIVLKPASQSPLSSLFIAELLQEAGLPDGALNVVTGSGRLIGERIVTDDRVRMITFTGSPAVGIGIRNQAGLKRVTLELGSNSALIVDKGVRIDDIIDRSVTGAFANQGQVCISLQRVYVHEEVHDEFVDQFIQRTRQLKIGDPLDPATDVSAVISPEDVRRLLDWIEEARQAGATIATGGCADGNVLHPTVILEAGSKLKVCCQEVFGPIVVINQVKSVDEAIQQVNESRFGLQAGIYTEHVHTALHAADQLHVGGVMINDIPSFRVDHMPYGGVKESGIGREGIKYAIEEMTEMKLVVWKK
ncbi:aldehyde dehydrogenase family protein [Paenibacillus dendritiformis]|uniref:Aldehyde dehydrogenase n=1 Tax=Paenibacillus dendritiformis C454 TaxID=1131935 RepID=H3SPE8_9BACL|nr:aldehyde dehydrogenase family protein [Paenibacillus dendritiformis]EHQ59036.1 aldehyde dehydrogenase [Paenibacillus dendritiformis C454]CAH8772607.1 aldehyde dehydrogenase family protein [Paenibacillus dendritiformis]